MDKAWPTAAPEVAEALISKEVEPGRLGGLLRVLTLGGGQQPDVEKARAEQVAPDVRHHSQQLDESFEQLAAGEFVAPRYNPLIWAQAPTQNTRLSRCIRTFARNTMGLGWSIEPIHPISTQARSVPASAPAPSGEAQASNEEAEAAGSQSPDGVQKWDGWVGTGTNGRAQPTVPGMPQAPQLPQQPPEGALRSTTKRLSLEEEKAAIEWQTELLRDLFERPNIRLPLTEVFYLIKVDEETTGNGYLEVVRDNSGKIVELHHCPATTIRRRLMKSGLSDPRFRRGDGSTARRVYGFIQIRAAQKRYFKEFGDLRVMNSFTGVWHGGEQMLMPGQRATEILHFRNYDPTSTYYGAPRYVPAASAIAGNRQAAIRNVSFFENDAVPRMALLVSGGRVTNESMQQIEDFIRGKGRGVEQAHRVMVIQVEPHKVGFQQQNKVMVELKPLTVGVTEDASFQTYRKANDEEVREIFGLAPVFFSTENVNKASAAVSREITNEQEFEPDRLSREYLINQTIVSDLLCWHICQQTEIGKRQDLDEEGRDALARKQIRVRFRFARLTLTDPLDTARMDQVYASLGAMTPNELRERIKLPRFPQDYYFADKPLPIAMAEMSGRIALLVATRDEEKPPAPEQPAEGGGGEGGTPPKPKGTPGMPGVPGMAALASKPFAEGISVEGLDSGEMDGYVPADPKKPTAGAQALKPEQGRLGVAPVKLPPAEGFRIATEMMAHAQRLAQKGADVVIPKDEEGTDGSK